MALRSGLLEMVRASIIGAILANLLMSLGVALLIGGVRHHNQEFNPRAARVYSSMMLLAVDQPGGPGAFSGVSRRRHLPQVHALNVRLAVMLMVVYALYLYFMLGTHADEFAGEETEHGHLGGARLEHDPGAGHASGASVLAAWMSEILVGAAEGTGEALGMSQTFIGMISSQSWAERRRASRPSPPGSGTSWT